MTLQGDYGSLGIVIGKVVKVLFSQKVGIGL